jgi:hypothetical protein
MRSRSALTTEARSSGSDERSLQDVLNRILELGRPEYVRIA